MYRSIFAPTGQTGKPGKGLHNALCPPRGAVGTVRDVWCWTHPVHLLFQPKMSYCLKSVPTETLVAKISLVAFPVPLYR